MITIWTFSQEARDYVTKIEKIVLIYGNIRSSPPESLAIIRTEQTIFLMPRDLHCNRGA